MKNESYKSALEVWYISKYAQSSLYGTPTRHFFLGKHIKKTGFNVKLIFSRSNGNINNPSLGFKNHIYEQSDDMDIVTINGPLISLGFNFKRIYSWIVFEFRLLCWALFTKQEKPDLIIVSSLSLLTFLSGNFLKNKYKCKLICEVRDIWPLTIIEAKGWSKGNLFIQCLSLIEKIGYKNADKIVGSMGNLEEYIANINPDFVNKVEYIPTGFEMDMYVRDQDILSEVDKKLQSIPKENFIVGYAGTIGRVNCVEHIIETALFLREEPISFVIVGNGVLRTQLQGKVEELKLKNLVFIGAYPKSSIPFILERCHVLLNPWLANVTIYKFGLSPNKWIEYMYSARPIIVSVDGFHNIINEAKCGVFVKAGDVPAIANSILYYKSLDRSQLNRIGENGKEFLLQNLSYPILAQKYRNVIEDVILQR